MINKKGAVGFNSKLLLKILIVAMSSFFWIYFLISSKLTVYAFRVFDLATILNSIFSLNFLLFAIFFPITSIIILAIIYNSIKEESLIVVGISLFLSLIFAIIFLKIKIYFVLFLILYILAHIILCLIAKKTSEKNMFNQTTNYLSKLTIFLVIGLFISSVLYILPEQSKKVEEFEAGLVNLFVADDLDPWISASYTINQQCTLSNLKFIMESKEYSALRSKTDETSSDFTDFMENIKYSAAANKTPEEIKELMPELDAPVIKVKIIDAIKSIPFIGFIESNFAFFFALVISSLAYTSLSIVFLIFAVTIYLFDKIFKKEEE